MSDDSLIQTDNFASFIPTMAWDELDDGLHTVQFYVDDDFLVGRIPHFLGAARGGRSAIILATQAHTAGIEAALARNGFSVD